MRGNCQRTAIVNGANVTVTFNGTVVPIYWKGVTDGVYAISNSYEPVAVVENATSDVSELP